jgi:fumarate reductase flavoprotein subunit
MDKQVIETDIVIVGAGGCGLTAALTAAENGARVLLLERDVSAGGSTSMSAGIFVAAGSRLQKRNHEYGTVEDLADDIFRLNGHQSDVAVTLALCRDSGDLMNWLVRREVPLEHMPGYKYPGMSHAWIHSPPERQGSAIVKALLRAVKAEPLIDLGLQTAVTGLSLDNGSVNGVLAIDSEGRPQSVRAKSVILATSGFGANSGMVGRHIPDLAGASYFGAPYAKGEAIEWGKDLGAELKNMSAYQSHSSIAYPNRMLVTTYLINHGAIQVNADGQRFGDETGTYAGHAVAVQQQPGRVVVELFDERILNRTLANYPRFNECQKAGIVKKANSLPELAGQFGLNSDNLMATVENYNKDVMAGFDQFGRTRFGSTLSSPYYGIQVTSALVQTLGGLRVNEQARVLRSDGNPLPGLFAGGGSATGLAGSRPEGYLAGTGLLAAFGLGRIAGQVAARE